MGVCHGAVQNTRVAREASAVGVLLDFVTEDPELFDLSDAEVFAFIDSPGKVLSPFERGLFIVHQKDELGEKMHGRKGWM